MTTTTLANTYITSPNFYFFFMVRTFKIFSHGNFQVYTTALLTIITMVYIIPKTYLSYN